MRLCDLSPELLLCIADHLSSAKHIDDFARSFRRAYNSLNHYLLCRFKNEILWQALNEQRPDLLRKVVHLQPDVNQYYRWIVMTGTPLGLAVRLNNKAMLKLLLEVDCIDIHCPFRYHETALEYAAANNKVDIMRLLLSHADMTAEAASEALFVAVRAASLEAVQLLMACNVDLNAKRKGETPLCVAAQCGYTSVQDLLLGDERVNLNCMNPVRDEPVILTLIRNAHYTQADRLTRLLDLHERVNLNVVDVQGNTALHFMAEKGHLLGCSFLVQHYPWMLSWTNCYGETPLFPAIQYLKPDICKYFLDQTDVDWKRPNLDGRTPILECVRKGNLESFKVLFERAGEAPVTASDNRGHSLLLEAAKYGNDEVVSFLIRKGADPNAQDEEGRTPLMLAACHNRITTVKLLLAVKGIKPGKKDNLGWTAFAWALWPAPGSEPNEEISDILLKRRTKFLWWMIKMLVFRRELTFWKESTGKGSAPVRISVK